MLDDIFYLVLNMSLVGSFIIAALLIIRLKKLLPRRIVYPLWLYVVPYAVMCIASPLTQEQTVTYAFQDSYLYVMPNGAYKIHYYLIVLILITMVCVLLYGIGQKRSAIVSVMISLFIVVVGISFSKVPASPAENINGCYEFDECLYMNPLSSFIAIKGSMPYVYGFNEESLIIANTETGGIEYLTAQYEKTPVYEDEFSSKTNITIFTPPDLSHYKERWLRGVFQNSSQQYDLYQMDDEIWLVNTKSTLWSIFRLQKTNKTNLSDLEQSYRVKENTDDTRQMDIYDVYELARKGKNLSASDFKPYTGKSVSSRTCRLGDCGRCWMDI